MKERKEGKTYFTHIIKRIASALSRLALPAASNVPVVGRAKIDCTFQLLRGFPAECFVVQQFHHQNLQIMVHR
jgi:hypothetical protein